MQGPLYHRAGNFSGGPIVVQFESQDLKFCTAGGAEGLAI